MSPAGRPLGQAEPVQLDEVVSAAVARGLDPAPTLTGDPQVVVRRVVHDSRLVTGGDAFCCVPGAHHDGHDLAPDAVAAGAVALVCERPLGLGVPEVRVPSVRAAMGPLAAAVEGFPGDALDLVGVTGTNGKTTVTHLVAGTLRAAGRSCGLIGTLSGARTTPEGPELQRLLAELRDEGTAAVAMEVSSHALDQHRVDGCRFAVAGFTNLSQDHLDYHGTMEAYFAAKARLFEPGRCALAVIDVDGPWGARLADQVEVPVVRCSLDDLADLRMGPDGSWFTWEGHEVQVRLPGRFNVANALVALEVVRALGVAPAAAAAGIATVGAVDGRFERIDEGQPFLAAVDYAHTPDGLRCLLEAARELTSGRVVVVFGAGGDRDRSKRPEMGAVAAELAHQLVLTSDNPRSEDPLEIIEQVRSGIGPDAALLVEPDRAAAIAAAVELAQPGDVLLVAGKGHETTQTVGEQRTPFDDRLVLRRALRAAGHRSTPEVPA